MRPVAISFDCANTLVETRWDYAVHGMDCARAIGLEPTEAWELAYRRRFYARLPEFRTANLGGNAATVREFWRAFTLGWCEEVRLPDSATDALMAASESLLYGAESAEFRVYDDVVPTLAGLRERGMRMAVLSNWDQSLERVLKSRGLRPYFGVVVASLVLGVEKPDSRIFEHLCAELEAPPERVWHVGDNPLDDVQGARGAGMRGLLIARDHDEASAWVLTDLRQLLDRVG